MIPNFDHLPPEEADAQIKAIGEAHRAREEHQRLRDEAEWAAEHDLEAWLDDQLAEFDIDDTAATVDPDPHIETPIVEQKTDPDAILDGLDDQIAPWIVQRDDPKPDAVNPIVEDIELAVHAEVPESESTEQPEHGVDVMLGDLDQDDEEELKAIVEAPELSDEEKGKIDALLDELEIIEEHDPDAMLDPLSVEDRAETPIVAEPQPAELVDTAEQAAIEFSDDALQAVHDELEAEETATALGGISDTQEKTVAVDTAVKSVEVSDDEEDTWERGRAIWHHTKNRMNDKPSEIVDGIRRSAPQYADAVEAFLTKLNSAKSKDKMFNRTAGHTLGGKKRKEIWAVKSPPELRAERKKQMARERQQRCRAARRAGTP